MNIETSKDCIKNLLITDKPKKRYVISFDKNYTAENNMTSVIWVENRREIELVLYALRDEVEVVLNKSMCERFSEVRDWLDGKTYLDIINGMELNYSEENGMMNIIEKIPLPRDIFNNFILCDNKSSCNLIEKSLVHKREKENVIISKPYNCGNMFYFQGFFSSAEYNIDHKSDHLEGLILLEVAKQASIASVHISGFTESGTIVASKLMINFVKFIENNQPYFIRTIPVAKQSGGHCSIIYQVIQNGQICANGYLSGVACRDIKLFDRFRNIKTIENQLL